jgi:hypothetical protein
VLSFYTLAFAISWGGFLLVVRLGPGGFSATPQQLQKDVPYAVLAMVLGPGLAGTLLTALIDGRAGLREFRSRLLRWRVGARWYAVALLTAPILITAVLLELKFNRAMVERVRPVTLWDAGERTGVGGTEVAGSLRKE